MRRPQRPLRRVGVHHIIVRNHELGQQEGRRSRAGRAVKKSHPLGPCTLHTERTSGSPLMDTGAHAAAVARYGIIYPRAARSARDSA